jgi:hypothetical protein
VVGFHESVDDANQQAAQEITSKDSVGHFGSRAV